MALKTAVHLIYQGTVMHLLLHYEMPYGQITLHQIFQILLLIHKCNICNYGSYFLTQTILQTGVCTFKEFQHKRLTGNILDIHTVFLHCIIFIHS